MKFTKDQTNIAKGVAICLMLAVHLYPIDSEQYWLINNNYYIPLSPIFNIEENIGVFGRICISMFLFLSGYGMLIGYKKYGKTALQYSLKKLTDFYQVYWLYFLIFIPIGLLFFRNVSKWNSTQPRYPLDIGIFIQNFIGWSHSYNEEWWFLQLFILILIFLCPVYLSLATRNIRLLIFLSLLLFIARIVLKIVWKVEDIYSFPGNLLYWQAPFAVGIIAGEKDLFASQLFQYFDTLKRVWIFAAVFLCYILGYLLPGTISDFLLAPFFIYFVNRTI